MNMRLAFRSFAAIALCLAASAADAQYGSTTPVYVPTAIYAPASYAAPGSVIVPTNGVGTVNVQLSGTYTGGSVNVAGTTSRAASPTFVTLSMIPRGTALGSKPLAAATSNGVYEINTQGMAQLRITVSAVGSGAIVVGASGTPGFYHIPANVDLGALITNTAQAAATVSSPDQLGGETTTVVCTFNQTANTAGSTVFRIENKDAASGLYSTLVTSAAITTANNTPSSIAAGAGVQASANVSSSLPIAATWRVTEVASGTSTTGTVGCNVH